MMAAAPRWTPARKELVLTSIRSRELTREQAMREHGLTPEELESWETRFSSHGRTGLKATRSRGAAR